MEDYDASSTPGLDQTEACISSPESYGYYASWASILADEMNMIIDQVRSATTGARFAVIVGENEVKAGAFALKNLATGEQVSVPRAELAKAIVRSA